MNMQEWVNADAQHVALDLNQPATKVHASHATLVTIQMEMDYVSSVPSGNILLHPDRSNALIVDAEKKRIVRELHAVIAIRESFHRMALVKSA